MRELEAKFPNELVVIGVHSGKYHAERETARIREASIRLGAAHPVLNDRQFRVWRAWAVNAWPTLAVIDPAGAALGRHAGEFTAELMAPVIERLVAEFAGRGVLNREPLHWAPDEPAIAPGTLRYPGKVALDGGSRRRIAVADSGHHRVLVGTLDDDGRRMRVEHVVGGGKARGGERGFADGAAHAARFDYPQGMAFAGTTLYVADAGNHAVREIDATTGAVRTLAGTGRQLRRRSDMEAGAMASPWDVAVVGDTELFVAMAGIHQIWAVSRDGGRVRRHSGTFREDIIDGPHGDAALAQPMGLAHDPRAGRLYFVDAESSGVRWADVDSSGGVGTLVGTGLFDFGDEDGRGDDVRMQHQQAIVQAEDGRLLVADSYNDALKWVDPATREATTWVRGLHEPGGLALGPRHVYVADTNAHRIAIVDRESGGVDELEIRL